MRNTVLTVVVSLLSTGCAFYALVYPAWFQQHYKRDGKDVFQSYGLFAFYSTGDLVDPFYASVTTLQYSDFCNSNSTPNYMVGDDENFRTVLCGKAMRSTQATTATGAAVSVVGLVMSVVAVFNPSAGKSERIVSFVTLVGSILLAVSLVIWGWGVQQRMYQVDSINLVFNNCKADRVDWSCWFYGYSFWVCLAAVILLSIAGYLSSAGRAEKIRYFRKEYERDLAVALQQSLEHDAAVATQHANGPTPHAAQFQRTHTGNNSANTGGYGAPPISEPQPMQPYEMAYPAFKEERQNHTLLGRQPSGGVV